MIRFFRPARSPNYQGSVATRVAPPGSDSHPHLMKNIRAQKNSWLPRDGVCTPPCSLYGTHDPPCPLCLHALLPQILALEMHRGLRPLGAAALPPPTPLKAAAPAGSGDGAGAGEAGEGADEGVGKEGSRAAAKAVEGFIRKNIEAYFGCWTSTYTLFSLDPRLVS